MYGKAYIRKPSGIVRIFQDLTELPYLLPNQDNIVASFSADTGLTSDTWENQVIGGNDINLYNADIVSDEYVKVTGRNLNNTADSYGLVEIEVSMACTFYLVFKTESPYQYGNNIYAAGFGGETITANWWSLSVDTYNSPNCFGVDMYGTGFGDGQTTPIDYHVAAVVRNTDGSGTIYVDNNTTANSSVNFSGTPHGKFCIGKLAKADGTLQTGANTPIYIRHLAIVNTSQTPTQIFENIQYLMNKYSI